MVSCKVTYQGVLSIGRVQLDLLPIWFPFRKYFLEKIIYKKTAFCFQYKKCVTDKRT